jgi:hypothetical protein
MRDLAENYRVTYTLDLATDDPVARLFNKNDQWAEIIDTGDGLPLVATLPATCAPPGRTESPWDTRVARAHSTPTSQPS